MLQFLTYSKGDIFGTLCCGALSDLRLGFEEKASDIYDGKVYQVHMENGFLKDKYNISVIFNTDGIPVFRSSSFSLWPLHIIVNKLPYRAR